MGCCDDSPLPHAGANDAGHYIGVLPLVGGADWPVAELLGWLPPGADCDDVVPPVDDVEGEPVEGMVAVPVALESLPGVAVPLSGTAVVSVVGDVPEAEVVDVDIDEVAGAVDVEVDGDVVDVDGDVEVDIDEFCAWATPPATSIAAPASNRALFITISPQLEPVFRTGRCG